MTGIFLALLLSVRAQAADTIELRELHERALGADPRSRQAALLERQSRLRTQSLGSERLPSVAAEALAQYQSDVTRVPVSLPGREPPVPPNDTYDARLALNQRLYDPTLGPRRALEGAQLGESLARVRTELHRLKQQVNDAYFAALRAQVQLGEIAAAIADLEAQHALAATRVREGVALPSEEAAIRAELLRRRQARAELEIGRRASLEVLSDLTGFALDSATALVLPDIESAVARARESLAGDAPRSRPEYAQFTRAREVLSGQQAVRAAQDRPRVSAFGRVGYGRPALDMFNEAFESYWLGGVQVQWTPWSWGTSGREREVLEVQRRILESEEEAFSRQLRRAVSNDLAAIDRLGAALAADDEIIALRERIAAETRVRFRENAVTSAEYVDRQTDALLARTTRAIHRVNLAQARARLLTTLGLEVP